MQEKEEVELSESEAEQYDRQIRLWGLESQKRLRASKILIIGLSGLGAEIAKNVILSGVKSVCLCDKENLKSIDFISQFLTPVDKIGCNRAQESLTRAKALNPMVDVTADTRGVEELPEDFFLSFDVVCVTGLIQRQYVRINNICRSNNKKFFCGDVWGMFGYMFADLVEHEYSEEIVQHKAVKRGAEDAANFSANTSTETTTTTVKKKAIYVPLQKALSSDWTKPKMRARLHGGDPSYFVAKILLDFRELFNRNPNPAKRQAEIDVLLHMRDTLARQLSLPMGFIDDEILTNVFGIVSESAAIIGAIIAQEVIKAVSQNEPPHNNMFFFNPLTLAGFIESYGYDE